MALSDRQGHPPIACFQSEIFLYTYNYAAVDTILTEIAHSAVRLRWLIFSDMLCCVDPYSVVDLLSGMHAHRQGLFSSRLPTI